MQSVKMDQILRKLVSDHSPFNLLSPQRVAEVANVVRIFELRENEIFQLKPGSGHDYMIVIEGQVGIIMHGALHSVAPQSTRKKPVLLRGAPDCPILVASMDSVACLVDGALLDGLVAWDGMMRLTENSDAQLHQRLASVRDSLVFRRMPLECVESAFNAMRTVYAKQGETVVSQGEVVDSFYIITAGRAELWQTGLYDDEPSKVADLGAGDTFGGEALLSGKAGSETVRVIEDVTLLVLSKSDFDELVSKELVRRIHPKVAKSMLETGYKALDVRYAEEYEERHIPGAIPIPLHELNQRMSELSKDEHYIVYCRSGSRSAVAALKLTQSNFDAATLEGGISVWPYEQTDNSAAPQLEVKRSPAAKPASRKVKPARASK